MFRKFTVVAIRRPVAVIVSLLALVIFGLASLFSTPLELSPSMSMPMFIISTVYGGAGPEEVESLVTSKIEGAIGTLSGLKNVQSISAENMSMVVVELEYGTDMSRANNDLQKKLNLINNSLPEDASDPTIMELSLDSTPVMQISVEATGDMDLLSYLQDNVLSDFEKLDGVASVDIYGGQETYMRVCLYPEKLRQYNLDMNTVATMISMADFSLPAGSIEQGGLSLALRGGVSYPDAQTLRTLPLTLSTGDIIHLSDIADVGEAQQKASSISRYNGMDTVTLSITKRDSASTRAVTSDCRQIVENINAGGLGLQMDITFNSMDEIWDSLAGVIQAMALAIVISMVILFLFLGDIKASLIIGTSMPISVLVTLIVMSWSGMTFNMLSLGGLTIGVGMMVDNSIVVLDSCFKKRDEFRSFEQAAIEGAGLVTSSVTASTITTVVVFLPIAMMQGISGQLFKDAGFTVVYALTASLISSLTLVPLLFLRLKPVERKESPVSRALRWVEQKYASLIEKSLGHRALVVVVAVAFLVASLCMLPAIGVELMPSSDAGIVSVEVQTRPGLKLQNIEKIVEQIEAVVVSQPDIESYSLTGSSGASVMSTSSANVTFSVYLKENRSVQTDEVVENIRRATKDMLDCEVQVSSSSGVSMGGGTDTVQDYLIGNDRDQLEAAAELIKSVMYQNPSVVNVTTSLADGSPQAEIVIDPVKSGAYGLAPMQVMSSVNMMVSGREAATIRMDGKDYSVRVEYPEDTYQTVSDLAKLNLTAPSGMQVPLLDIATIRYSNSPQQVMRYNNQYVVTVTGQLSARDAARSSSEVTQAVYAAELPSGVDHFFGGSIQTMNEEFAAIFGAMGTAVFLVFMVMAIQFNSIRFSLMVMLSIPFSLIGAFAGLLLTNTTISMTSLMGMILLAGIVVNNAIVLIDYANQLRDEGMEVKRALAKAGRTRLRPILMTTLTTVLGMVPMAIGMGSNAEMMRGMAMVVIGGLSASTILTLILIPTFYLIFSKKRPQDKAEKGSGDGSALEQGQEEYPQSLPQHAGAPDTSEEARQPV
ncbi:MAG: efflux RND transporter permease subunit [Provencibacterium sp.]|jgi:CzcA family heavy metal efflux pump|nr:efflux RND transporter permease subunit [Provencibacterium sp.]